MTLAEESDPFYDFGVFTDPNAIAASGSRPVAIGPPYPGRPASILFLFLAILATSSIWSSFYCAPAYFSLLRGPEVTDFLRYGLSSSRLESALQSEALLRLSIRELLLLISSSTSALGLPEASASKTFIYYLSFRFFAFSSSTLFLY